MTDITHCKNCDTVILANYCANCGQKQYSRISRNYILQELQETLIQTNRGFLFTLKSLILNPGKTAREYIDGKRTMHYKPLPLLFLLSTISVFISFKLLDLKEASISMNENLYGKSNALTAYMDFVSNYSSFIILLTIPLIALTSYLAFKKNRENYYEHIIAAAYFYSFTTILSIFLFTPLNYIYRSEPMILMGITAVAVFLPFLVYIWFWREFYPELNMINIIKGVGLQLLFTLALFIVCMIAGVIFALIYIKLLS